MAASATKRENLGIFWMNGVSDEEQPLVFVSGVDGEVKTKTPFSLGQGSTSTSSKRSTKMPPRKGYNSKNETKLKTSSTKQGQSHIQQSGANNKEKVSVCFTDATSGKHNPNIASGKFYPTAQVMSETTRAKSLVSLKDLFPEDKRRIANLIEELARVSEEKEESVQRLKDEQETFERKIQQLEQQNVIIAQERGSLQQQYKECRELLGLYQQYLSQQQAKLNQSITRLSQAQSKVLSSEEAPSRANVSIFDGSYVGFASAGADQPQVTRNGSVGEDTAQSYNNSSSQTFVSGFSLTNGQMKRHKSQRSHSREPNLGCEHCPGMGQDSGYQTQQQRGDDGPHSGNEHHQIFDGTENQRLPSGNAIGSEAKEALSSPQLGHEDWEEKRHQLLMQKMQLEMERERLHARLAAQEERLSRQNQQLLQSRLDNSRFQQATKSDLCASKSGNEDKQPLFASLQDLNVSVCEETEDCPERRSLHEKPSQTLHNANESSGKFKHNMASSPAKSATSLNKPESESGIQKTRMDYTVAELLDILTPVNAPKIGRPSTQRLALSSLKPVGRTLHTPAGSDPQQDLEESQILEDIFFIC